jgi:hypothetical protein
MINLQLTPTLFEHQLDDDIMHASGLYLRSRLKQIDEMRGALALEARAINAILPLVDAESCPECHGQKGFWVHTDQDSGYTAKCKTCDGSGKP